MQKETRTCKKNLTFFCHFLNLSVTLKASDRIRNAFRFKDIIPTFKNSKVLYKFKCNICSDVYISETKRYLLVRHYEYLGKSILTEKPSKYKDEDETAIKNIAIKIITRLILLVSLQLVVLPIISISN